MPSLVVTQHIWLVVTDVSQDQYRYRWQVVRDNICSSCGQPVTAKDMTRQLNPKQAWNTPHGYCRETWQKQNWQPTLFCSDDEEEQMKEGAIEPGS